MTYRLAAWYVSQGECRSWRDDKRAEQSYQASCSEMLISRYIRNVGVGDRAAVGGASFGPSAVSS